jgi:hypothetical protein
MGWPGPVTHRQYMLWHRWFGLQWNRPSRDNWYLMAIAAEVRRVLSKQPRSIKEKHFKLKFDLENPEGPPKNLSPEEVKKRKIELSTIAKAKVGAMLGIDLPTEDNIQETLGDNT